MRKKVFLGIMVLICAVCSLGAKKGIWTEYKCQHFLIYYKNAPLALVKTIEKSAEEYYNEIMQNLGFRRYQGWTWENRAKIYIYDDQEDYQNTSNQYNWSSGTASTSTKVIKTFPAAAGFFDATLPHELGHIIFREFVGHNVWVPLWFEEGVAMYQEKAKRWGAHKKVKKAIANKSFIPLEELGKMRLTNGTSREIIHMFYDEAASVVNYLVEEFGEHRFSRFCREIRDKKNFKEALKTTYTRFKDVDALNKAWMRYVEK